MSALFPWLSLVGIIWLQAISGTNTDFAAYSCLLKSRLDITQVQLNNLAFASDAGKLFGWFSGIAATRFPLWSILVVGIITGAIGYGVQFLSLRPDISPLPYWHYFILQILAGTSICWVNTSCYITAMRKFPADHGFVLGLATSYTGLSAKVYVVIAQMLTGTNSSNRSIYLLLNCFVPIGIGLVTAPLLMETKPAMTGNRKGLLVVFVLAGATGIYAVVDTLAPKIGNLKMPEDFLLVMVALVAVVVPLVMFSNRKQKLDSAAVIAAEEHVVETESEEGNGSESEEEVKKLSGEHQVWKLVKSVEFWLYFLVYLCGGTMGLVYANNLGQIAKSRGVPEAVLLSISSSFGFFGKLSAAPMSLFTRLVCWLLLDSFIRRPWA